MRAEKRKRKRKKARVLIEENYCHLSDKRMIIGAKCFYVIIGYSS